MQMTKPMKHFHSLILVIAALLMTPAVASAQGKVYKPHPERQKVEQPKAAKPKSGKSKKNNKPAPIKKDVPAQSQAPETTPVPQPAPPVKQQPQPKPKPAFMPRTTYNNLDLQAVRDGQTFYISKDEWANLSDSERALYNRKGVVVSGSENLPAFVIDLYESGAEMNWNEASHRYGNKLPNYQQACKIAGSAMEITNAIKAFGGDQKPYSNIWAGAADKSRAYYIAFLAEKVLTDPQTSTHRVRAVWPI